MSGEARIVQGDNFGMSGEMPGRDEKFVLWPLPTEIATKIAALLNNASPEDGPYFYRTVETDYKLSTFEP